MRKPTVPLSSNHKHVGSKINFLEDICNLVTQNLRIFNNIFYSLIIFMLGKFLLEGFEPKVSWPHALFRRFKNIPHK
jgi:F0F1-type ATP synthase membrane subunit a